MQKQITFLRESSYKHINSNFLRAKSVIPKDDAHELTKKISYFILLVLIMCLTYSMPGNIWNNYSCHPWGPKKLLYKKYLAEKLLCNRNISYYESDPGFQEMLMLSGKQKEGAGGGEQRGREGDRGSSWRTVTTDSRRGVRTVRSRPCFPPNNSYMRDISNVNRPGLLLYILLALSRFTAQHQV